MIENTGERIIPALMKPSNFMLLEHMARYFFATPYVRGRVLDLACGAGYGTHLVAKTCKHDIEEMVGADIDPAIVEYAARTYYHPLSRFQTADALDEELPEKLGQFDTILSFETLEHVPDDTAFIRQLARLLKPGGTAVISTPFGAGKGLPSNQAFHKHQLTLEEFMESVSIFPMCEMYYQRGVTFEPKPRPGVRYPFGIAVCRNDGMQG